MRLFTANNLGLPSVPAPVLPAFLTLLMGNYYKYLTMPGHSLPPPSHMLYAELMWRLLTFSQNMIASDRV